MGLLKSYYKHKHPEVPDEKIPGWYKVSIWGAVKKKLRKYFSAVVIPTIPFNGLRIACYRLCGYKVGGGTFIGMRCYLDDLCYDKIVIGNNVTISYGVYFAGHGRKQGHHRIIIEDGAYIGMRASIIAPNDITIGKKAIVGACSLVNRSIGEGEIVAGVPAKPLHKKEDKTNEGSHIFTKEQGMDVQGISTFRGET